MKPHELIDHYGNAPRAAEQLGVTKQAVYKWRDQGFIPFNTQYRIQVITQRKLVADRDRVSA